MAQIGSLQEVEHILDSLIERGYVRRLGRRPGQKEDRFEQLLGGAGPEETSQAEAPAAVDGAYELADRVRALEAEVAALRDQLARLTPRDY
jgi:uncharacterized protein YceH (UPF0502 family)